MPRVKRVVAVASAALLAVVLASAAPAARRDAPTLTLTDAKLSASWKESWLTGSVTFSGDVGTAANLRASLRRVDGGPVAAALAFTTAGAESFTKTLKLPSRLLPGSYRISVGGEATGGAHLATVTRDVVNPAPKEGIVDKAWASARSGGPPIATVKGPRRELWAYFHFVVRPKSTKLRVGWHSPSFRWYGQATKPYKQTFASHVGTKGGLTLERGVWFIYLWSGNKVVKRARVRIS